MKELTLDGLLQAYYDGVLSNTEEQLGSLTKDISSQTSGLEAEFEKNGKDQFLLTLVNESPDALRMEVIDGGVNSVMDKALVDLRSPLLDVLGRIVSGQKPG